MNKQSILLGSSFYDWCLDARLDLGGFSVIAGLSLPKIKSVRIDGAAHQGQAALRCAQRAE